MIRHPSFEVDSLHFGLRFEVVRFHKDLDCCCLRIVGIAGIDLGKELAVAAAGSLVTEDNFVVAHNLLDAAAAGRSKVVVEQGSLLVVALLVLRS